MIRIHDCKDVPVMCMKDGMRLGFLTTPLYDGEKNIKGFLIEGNSGISLKIVKKYISLDDILKLNKDVCVVYSKDSAKKFSSKSGLSSTNPMENAIGKNVVTSFGENVGVVYDFVFDITTGSLEGLELSKGFMNDMIDGRKIVYMRDGVEFGEEFVIALGEEYTVD